MKFSEVSDSDMKMFGQLINLVQVAEFSLSGKDVCISSDTLRWLQKIAVDAAQTYKESKASGNIEPPSSSHLPPIGEGISIKSVGKKK